MVEWSPEEQEKSSSKPVGSATCGGAHGSIALDTREWGAFGSIPRLHRLAASILAPRLLSREMLRPHR